MSDLAVLKEMRITLFNELLEAQETLDPRQDFLLEAFIHVNTLLAMMESK
jgi:hypothetical protein